ncbi:hypothetical protein HLI_21275 (plasmid) [Halobacillus litoralis]|uniref:Uncharacterized protein n=2 Tax=Halobacillus litoralis TaxID=45668 RepID=A0A410MJ92_9BACI|nr:hypothetical protein HLI_21275 [Halobacillus litoralis]
MRVDFNEILEGLREFDYVEDHSKRGKIIEFLLSFGKPSPEFLDSIDMQSIEDVFDQMMDWPIDSDESGEILYLDPTNDFDKYLKQDNTFYNLVYSKGTYEADDEDVFI